MGTINGLEDLAGLAADLARLEMDRDSCDIVFVVRDIIRRIQDKMIRDIFSGWER